MVSTWRGVTVMALLCTSPLLLSRRGLRRGGPFIALGFVGRRPSLCPANWKLGIEVGRFWSGVEPQLIEDISIVINVKLQFPFYIACRMCCHMTVRVSAIAVANFTRKGMRATCGCKRVS